jgi:hypothetical protein
MLRGWESESCSKSAGQREIKKSIQIESFEFFVLSILATPSCTTLFLLTHLKMARPLPEQDWFDGRTAVHIGQGTLKVVRLQKISLW